MHEPTPLHNMHNAISENRSIVKKALEFVQALHMTQIRAKPAPTSIPRFPVPPEILPAIAAAIATAVRRIAVPHETDTIPHRIRYAASNVKAAVVNMAAASGRRYLRSAILLPFCFNEKIPLAKQDVVSSYFRKGDLILDSADYSSFFLPPKRPPDLPFLASSASTRALVEMAHFVT